MRQLNWIENYLRFFKDIILTFFVTARVTFLSEQAPIKSRHNDMLNYNEDGAQNPSDFPTTHICEMQPPSPPQKKKWAENINWNITFF